MPKDIREVENELNEQKSNKSRNVANVLLELARDVVDTLDIQLMKTKKTLNYVLGIRFG